MKTFQSILIICCLAISIGWTAHCATPDESQIVLFDGFGIDPDAMPPPGDHIDFLLHLESICGYLDAWQVKDPMDPEFGGMIEDEFRTGDERIVESDNTQESIYVWSRFCELTGRHDFDENIQNAWTYLSTYPAWLETPLWYGIWNCGWGLQCSRKYRQVYGDESIASYSESSADLIMNNDLPFDASPPKQGTLHALVMAWAGWNLYQYGMDTGNEAYLERAREIAGNVNDWLELSSNNINKAAWALSGGVTAACVLEVLYGDDPIAAESWRDSHLSDLIVYYDPDAYATGNWVNAWNAWQALAQNALWRCTGEFSYRRTALEQSDNIRRQDTDSDGGIPAHPNETNEYDQTWVTTYIVLMGFAGLDDPPDLRMNMTDTSVQAGDPFDYSIQIYGPGLDTDIDLYMLLEIGGVFYSVPQFNDTFTPIPLSIPIDFDLAELAGMQDWLTIVNIPEWPSGIGPLSGTWYGALFEQGTFDPIGDIQMIPWQSM